MGQYVYIKNININMMPIDQQIQELNKDIVKLTENMAQLVANYSQAYADIFGNNK